MDLPRITGGPVQDEVSPALQREASAVQGLTDTLSQGLTVMGQEMVRTQTQDAHLRLSSGLNDLVTDLRNRKAIPVDELKAQLGDDFEKLDPAVRNQPLVPVLDANGLPVVDPSDPTKTVTKPGDVPTFMVADVLYKRAAQKLLDDASKQITVGSGWQASFQRAALADVFARGAHLNDAMLHEFRQYQGDRRTQQAIQYANAGDFRMAHLVVDGSGDILGPDGQAKLRQHIVGMQQERGPRDALLHFRTDPASPLALAELREASAALADDKRSGGLDPKKRDELANQVHSALTEANRVNGTRQAASLALQLVRENTDATHKVNAEAAYAALDAKFAPGGPMADRPELWKEARGILRESLSDQTESRKQNLNDLAGAALEEYLGLDQAGKPHMAFSNVTPQTRAALKTFGKDGEELLAQFVKWDQANEMHDRQRRNLPTPQESAKALAIEYALATREKEVAALGPSSFSALLLGGGNEALGIPAGAVSPAHVGHLSELFARAAKPEKRQYLVKPESIAFEEAMEAFPSLKSAVQKKGEAKGRVAVAEDVRKAVGMLTDRVAKYIDEHPGPDGRGPSQDEIRKEAKRLLQTVEVKKTFFGIRYGTERKPALQVEAAGGDSGTIVVPEGVTVPGAAPRGELVPNDSRKPIIENKDGTFSTEKTVAFHDDRDGKETTIATIVNGKEYAPKEAWQLYLEGKNPALAKHDTVAEANEYARKRHNEEQRTREKDRRRRVNSIEEARKLPKGTRFIDPNGVERVR